MGFYHSIPSWFNLPHKHSLFPCVRVGWSLASRARCTPMGTHNHFPHPYTAPYSTACPRISSLDVYLCFLEVSLLLLSSIHLLLLPLRLSAKILGKAKHSSLPVCMTRWRWYVKQEAIRADYSDSSSSKKKEHSTKDGKTALLPYNYSWQWLLVHKEGRDVLLQSGCY